MGAFSAPCSERRTVSVGPLRRRQRSAACREGARVLAEALLDRSASFRALAQPAMQIALDEFVVLKIRIAGAYSIYFLELPWRKVLFRVETPTPGEKPL